MEDVNDNQFIENPPNLSQEDMDYYGSTKKMFPNEDEFIIGIHKYNHLKELERRNNNYNFINPDLEPKTLTDLQKKQIEFYETSKAFNSEEIKQKRAEHVKNVLEGKKTPIETVKGSKIDVKNLYHGFIIAFKLLNNKNFELTKDSILNIEAVVKYFAKDPSFFECERLIKEVGDRKLVPSFLKGILIVGDFGNGKSTILQTFEYLINHNYKLALEQKWDNFKDWNNLRFKVAACRNIASEYEFLKKDDSKQEFLSKYSRFNYCFDDITKEQIASNYGLKNVIQIILENRYDDIFEKTKENKKINKTHGTLNYHKEHPGNLKIALQSLGVKYQPHIYDRALEMFNIIEFKGKSFRA
jgi:DNA replication protein DnaC